MLKKCLDCNLAIEHNRKRCKVCAYDHHKKQTAEQRRIRTTLIYGWDHPRICCDCGGQFVDDKRFGSGPPRKRCQDCHAAKYGPRPDRNCRVCHVVIPAKRSLCDGCRPVVEAEQRRASAERHRERNRKPPVICTVCGNTSINRQPVCSLCGKAARRREAGRLRGFRERLFTSIVHEPTDVEFILRLLDSPCRYCGSTEEITVEHITPLIRGGSHTIDNLGPACRSCNSSKQALTEEEFAIKNQE
jgi:5-methylcytosine-specific restriction endonuclease McrA